MDRRELARLSILGTIALFLVALWGTIAVVGMLQQRFGALEVAGWIIVTVGAALIGAMFRKCPRCERVTRDVKRRRLNTAYVNEADNWHTSCGACHQDGLEHFEQMWQEYYSMRG